MKNFDLILKIKRTLQLLTLLGAVKSELVLHLWMSTTIMGISCDYFSGLKLDRCVVFRRLHHSENSEPKGGEEESVHPNIICHLAGCSDPATCHWQEMSLYRKYHSQLETALPCNKLPWSLSS